MLLVAFTKSKSDKRMILRRRGGCFLTTTSFYLGLFLSVSSLALVRVQQAAADSSASMDSSINNHRAYANLSPTIFAPGGRLHSVEHTLRAIQQDVQQNNLVIALQCRHGDIVVVTSDVTSPYLCYLNATTTTTPGSTDATTDTTDNASENVTVATASSASFASLQLPNDNDGTTGVARPPFLRLSTRTWGITAGPATDAQLLRLQLHGIAEQLRYRQGDGSAEEEQDSLAQPSVIARALADVRQRATQQSGGGGSGNNDDNDDDYGLLNATALIFSSSSFNHNHHNPNGGDGDSSLLWRVDPTGQFFQCQAAVVGRQAHVAEADLIQRLKEKQDEIVKNKEDDSDESISSSSNSSEPMDTDKAMTTTPQQLRDLVADLSREDALQMAKECIRRTLEPKQTFSASQPSSQGAITSSPPPPPLFLRAFCLSSSSSSPTGTHTAQWYSHQDLLENEEVNSS